MKQRLFPLEFIFDTLYSLNFHFSVSINEVVEYLCISNFSSTKTCFTNNFWTQNQLKFQQLSFIPTFIFRRGWTTIHITGGRFIPQSNDRENVLSRIRRKNWAGSWKIRVDLSYTMGSETDPSTPTIFNNTK